MRRYLDALGVAYELVPTLVRGLDYYTRTTWEFVGPEGGSQSHVSGGGRYDGLAEALGGPPTPGVGFGAGIERLLLALEGDPGAGGRRDRRVLRLCEGADRAAVLAKVAELRAAGVKADTDFAGRSVKGQHTQASARRRRIVSSRARCDVASRAPGRRVPSTSSWLGSRMSWRDLHCGGRARARRRRR